MISLPSFMRGMQPLSIIVIPMPIWTDLIPSGIKAGDVVDYYIAETNRPHSAVVYSLVLNLVSSKWGSAGLYVHKPTEVPAGYISRDLGYYRL